jgi:hypothetical protein
MSRYVNRRSLPITRKRLPWCEPIPGAAWRGKAGRWDLESPANPSDPQCAGAIVLYSQSSNGGSRAGGGP